MASRLNLSVVPCVSQLMSDRWQSGDATPTRLGPIPTSGQCYMYVSKGGGGHVTNDSFL